MYQFLVATIVSLVIVLITGSDLQRSDVPWVIAIGIVPGFIGLTHLDDSENPHLPFEKSLGIVAQLVPLTGPEFDPADNEYQVNHGVTLMLLNPQGRLQAIFEPDTPAPGQHAFNPETLLRDYLAIRQYLG